MPLRPKDQPPSLREYLRSLTREERAGFLMRYAARFGKAYPRQRDDRGYKLPIKRKRKPQPPEKTPDAIGEEE